MTAPRAAKIAEAADYCRRHAADEALSADTLRSCFADLAAYLDAAPAAPSDQSTPIVATQGSHESQTRTLRPGSTPSDDALLLEMLYAAVADERLSTGALYREAADRICALTAELAQARAQPCPHVVTSDEGTSYCNLAESSVRELKAELERYQEDRLIIEAERNAATARADALYTENAKLREMLHLVMSIHTMTDEQLAELAANARAALAEQEKS